MEVVGARARRAEGRPVSILQEQGSVARAGFYAEDYRCSVLLGCLAPVGGTSWYPDHRGHSCALRVLGWGQR